MFEETLAVTEKMALNHVYLLNQSNDCFAYCSDLNSMKSKLIEYFEINKFYRKASDEETELVNDVAYAIVFDGSLKHHKTNYDLLST